MTTPIRTRSYAGYAHPELSRRLDRVSEFGEGVGMPTGTRTPKHQLIDVHMVAKTGKDLAAYVSARRADGVSWRVIARSVHDLTGVDVAEQSLLDWGLGQ